MRQALLRGTTIRVTLVYAFNHDEAARSSMKAQNETADAEWVHAEFTEAWKNADTELRVDDLRFDFS